MIDKIRGNGIMIQKREKIVPANKKGFTLIEVLVVVAIIAILATIAITQYGQYRQKAQDATAISDLKAIQTTAEAYYAEHMKYPH